MTSHPVLDWATEALDGWYTGRQYRIMFFQDGGLRVDSMFGREEVVTLDAKRRMQDHSTSARAAALAALRTEGHVEIRALSGGMVLGRSSRTTDPFRVLGVRQRMPLCDHRISTDDEALARRALVPEAARLSPGETSQVVHDPDSLATLTGHQHLSLRARVPEHDLLMQRFGGIAPLYLTRIDDIAVLSSCSSSMMTLNP